MDMFKRGIRKKKDATSESTKPYLWQEDEKRVREATCSFQVKYHGCVEVFESRGIQVCEDAVNLLKNNRKRIQRAILYVSGDALRVVDELNRGLIVDQTIEKVSFCAPDRNNDKGFAYICRDGTTRRWMCHVFMAVKESGERLSHAVGCAFTICLERKQTREKEKASVAVNSDANNFTRTGSFRPATLIERLADPQSTIIADPVPVKKSDNPFAIQRPRASSDLFQRQSSLRVASGESCAEVTQQFQRQMSLTSAAPPTSVTRHQWDSGSSSSAVTAVNRPTAAAAAAASKLGPVLDASPSTTAGPAAAAAAAATTAAAERDCLSRAYQSLASIAESARRCEIGCQRNVAHDDSSEVAPPSKVVISQPMRSVVRWDDSGSRTYSAGPHVPEGLPSSDSEVKPNWSQGNGAFTASFENFSSSNNPAFNHPNTGFSCSSNPAFNHPNTPFSSSSNPAFNHPNTPFSSSSNPAFNHPNTPFSSSSNPAFNHPNTGFSSSSNPAFGHPNIGAVERRTAPGTVPLSTGNQRTASVLAAAVANVAPIRQSNPWAAEVSVSTNQTQSHQKCDVQYMQQSVTAGVVGHGVGQDGLQRISVCQEGGSDGRGRERVGVILAPPGAGEVGRTGSEVNYASSGQIKNNEINSIASAIASGSQAVPSSGQVYTALSYPTISQVTSSSYGTSSFTTSSSEVVPPRMNSVWPGEQVQLHGSGGPSTAVMRIGNGISNQATSEENSDLPNRSFVANASQINQGPLTGNNGGRGWDTSGEGFRSVNQGFAGSYTSQELLQEKHDSVVNVAASVNGFSVTPQYSSTLPRDRTSQRDTRCQDDPMTQSDSMIQRVYQRDAMVAREAVYQQNRSTELDVMCSSDGIKSHSDAESWLNEIAASLNSRSTSVPPPPPDESPVYQASLFNHMYQAESESNSPAPELHSSQSCWNTPVSRNSMTGSGLATGNQWILSGSGNGMGAMIGEVRGGAVNNENRLYDTSSHREIGYVVRNEENSISKTFRNERTGEVACDRRNSAVKDSAVAYNSTPQYGRSCSGDGRVPGSAPNVDPGVMLQGAQYERNNSSGDGRTDSGREGIGSTDCGRNDSDSTYVFDQAPGQRVGVNSAASKKSSERLIGSVPVVASECYANAAFRETATPFSVWAVTDKSVPQLDSHVAWNSTVAPSTTASSGVENVVPPFKAPWNNFTSVDIKETRCTEKHTESTSELSHSSPVGEREHSIVEAPRSNVERVADDTFSDNSMQSYTESDTMGLVLTHRSQNPRIRSPWSVNVPSSVWPLSATESGCKIPFAISAAIPKSKSPLALDVAGSRQNSSNLEGAATDILLSNTDAAGSTGDSVFSSGGDHARCHTAGRFRLFGGVASRSNEFSRLCNTSQSSGDSVEGLWSTGGAREGCDGSVADGAVVEPVLYENVERGNMSETNHRSLLIGDESCESESSVTRGLPSHANPFSEKLSAETSSSPTSSSSTSSSFRYRKL